MIVFQVRLEEKQRAKRRKREALASKAAEAAAAGNHEEAKRLEKQTMITPTWFKKEYDHLTNSMLHVYKGGYWETKQKGSWDEVDMPDLYWMADYSLVCYRLLLKFVCLSYVLTM